MVGELLATSRQWVNADEDCEGEACGPYGGWRVDYAAGGTNYRVSVSCGSHCKVPNKCSIFTLLQLQPLAGTILIRVKAANEYSPMYSETVRFSKTDSNDG